MATAAPSSLGTGSWAGPLPLPARPLPFDAQQVCVQVALLCGLFMLNKAGNVGAAAFFLILFIMAAKSTEGALKALVLVGLGVTLNQYFVPKSIVWTPTRLALSVFCALRCFTDVYGGPRSFRMAGYFPALCVYCATAAACSLLSGYYVLIALLKLANFFTVTAGTLLAIEATRRRRIDMTPWFVAVIGSIVAFGLLSLATGQSTNFMRYRAGMSKFAAEAGFNGAFLHPNVHSTIVAPAFIFLVAAAVFSTYRNRWICGVMAAILGVFMVYSQARTSIVSTLVGLIVIIFYAGRGRFVRGRRMRLNVGRGTMIGLMLLGAVGVAVGDLATGGAVRRSVISFVNKSANEEEISTAEMLVSREGKIALSWSNFLKSPIYGIGFQVSTEEYFRQNATLFTAPAEKGFLYTAILEEGGVLGTTTFVVFFVLFLTAMIRTRNVPGLAVFLTLFVANTFEVGLFAMGGTGTFFWTFAGAAIMLGDHCWDVAAPPRVGWDTGGPARVAIS